MSTIKHIQETFFCVCVGLCGCLNREAKVASFFHAHTETELFNYGTWPRGNEKSIKETCLPVDLINIWCGIKKKSYKAIVESK